MNRRILPGALKGLVERIPSSKSQTHRMMIAAYLSGAETVLEGITFSRDAEATMGCLQALGAKVTRQGDRLTLLPGPRTEDEALLDCGESGSTLRFMLPVAAALGVKAAFDGRGKLPGRPLSPLYEEMAAHGVRLTPQGTFPLRISGRLQPGRYAMAGNVSSQFFSGLLLALPLAAGESSIRVEGPLESAPYVNMTLDTPVSLRRAGSAGTGWLPGSRRTAVPQPGHAPGGGGLERRRLLAGGRRAERSGSHLRRTESPLFPGGQGDPAPAAGLRGIR